MDVLVTRSDVIAIHVRLTVGTTGLPNEERLHRMNAAVEIEFVFEVK